MTLLAAAHASNATCSTALSPGLAVFCMPVCLSCASGVAARRGSAASGARSHGPAPALANAVRRTRNASRREREKHVTTSQNDLEAMLKQSLATPSSTASGTWKGVMHAELSHAIVGVAIEVHRRIGPGQLESVYQRSLAS